MKTSTIDNILKFLETKENKKIPQEWADLKPMNSLIKKFENHPDGVQYRHEGNLFLGYSVLKELPNDLYVEYNLSLIFQYLLQYIARRIGFLLVCKELRRD